MRTFSLYLSTTTPNGNYKPVTKTNLANVTWNINWRELFGEYKGEVNVRVKLITNSTTGLTWASNVGSLRANFYSNYANVSNGVNLGYIRPYTDFATTANTYLDVDTITGNGLTIQVPTSNQNITISMLKADETLMTNYLDYQLWLYFDETDDTPKMPYKST